MKNRFTALLIFLFCMSSSLANGNYLEYHRKVIEIEERFLDGRLEQALGAYKRLFESYQPFARDAFIALQLACMKGDSAYAFYFLKKSFRAGVPWTYTDRVSHIHRFLKKSPSIERRARKIFEEENAAYNSKLNHQLRVDFKARSATDDLEKKRLVQRLDWLHEWTVRHPDSFQLLYGKELMSNPVLQRYAARPKETFDSAYFEFLKRLTIKRFKPIEFEKRYVQVLDSNLLAVITISKELGYVPGERTTGIIDWENSHSVGYMFMVPQVVHLLYHHGCGYWLLNDELQESVRRGELHPRIYLCLHDFSYCMLKDASNDNSHTNFQRSMKVRCEYPVRTTDYRIVNIAGCIEPQRPDTDVINFLRDEWAVSSIEHDLRKKGFAEKHNLVLSFGIFLGEEL